MFKGLHSHEKPLNTTSLFAFAASLLLFVVMEFSSPTYGGFYNSFCLTLTPLVFFSLVAYASGVLLSIRIIDVSSGYFISFFGGFLVLMFFFTESIVLSILLSIAAAALIYYILSSLVARTGVSVSSLLCTLAFGYVLYGFSLGLEDFLTGGRLFTNSLGSGEHPGRDPIANKFDLDWTHTDLALPNLIILTLTTGALFFWRFYTHAGIRHLAVGLDSQSAKDSGVNAERYRICAIFLAGALFSLAALHFFFARNGGEWDISSTHNVSLPAIATCVIAGVRVFGGHFNPINILSVSLLFVLVERTIGKLHISAEFDFLVLGLFMFAALFAFHRNHEDQ